MGNIVVTMPKLVGSYGDYLVRGALRKILNYISVTTHHANSITNRATISLVSN